MSRDYRGTAYRALLVLDDGTVELVGMTDPAAYEDVERLVLAVGFGVPYEGRRVKRALIVPVAGEEAPEPGHDWRMGR